MPYIDPQARVEVSAGRFPAKVGELNYVVTQLVDSWLTVVGVNYGSLNAAVGVLECAKLELYRRLAAPYEDGKLAENGEVYHSATKKEEPRIEVPNGVGIALPA